MELPNEELWVAYISKLCDFPKMGSGRLIQDNHVIFQKKKASDGLYKHFENYFGIKFPFWENSQKANFDGLHKQPKSTLASNFLFWKFPQKETLMAYISSLKITLASNFLS